MGKSSTSKQVSCVFKFSDMEAQPKSTYWEK